MRTSTLTMRAGVIALAILGASVSIPAPALAGTTDFDLIGRGYDCVPFTSSSGQSKLLCTKQGAPPQICDGNGDHCHEAARQTPAFQLSDTAAVNAQLVEQAPRPSRRPVATRPISRLRR